MYYLTTVIRMVQGVVEGVIAIIRTIHRLQIIRVPTFALQKIDEATLPGCHLSDSATEGPLSIHIVWFRIQWW